MSFKDLPALPLAFTKVMEDFQRSFQNFERLHEMQRRNLTALIEVNQISLEAVEVFSRRQTDLMRRTTEIFAAAAIDMIQAKSPAEIAQRQLSVTRDAFLMTQTELRSLARMTVDAQKDAGRVYADQVVQTIDAMGTVLQPGEGPDLSPERD